MNAKARIVLQDRKSLLYLKHAGAWTRNIQEASEFVGLLQAREFCRRERLANMDALMTFGDPQYDVRVSASP